MASTPEFVEYVVDQLQGAGNIRYKAMFGEYGLYCDEVFFGMICDNKFFVKPTDEGRAFIKTPQEAPPYPGAKNSLLIEEKLEDQDWVQELVKITVKALGEKKK